MKLVILEVGLQFLIILSITDVIFTFILQQIEDILGVAGLCKKLSHIHVQRRATEL